MSLKEESPPLVASGRPDVADDPAARAPYFVRTASRVLAVIQAFGADRPAMTLAQVATRVSLDRATTRLLLLTLRDIGYVGYDGRLFSLTPRVLQLGYAYLSGMTLAQIAQQHLHEVAEELGETAALTVLDGDEVLYIAVAASYRLSTVRVSVGTRFPAHLTSMGRILLGALPDDRLEDFLDRLDRRRRDEAQPRAIEEIRAEILATRERGWATVDGELEIGLRGVAVPVSDATGKVIATVNVSAHASRSSAADLEALYVPAIRRTAERIESGYVVGIGRIR